MKTKLFQVFDQSFGDKKPEITGAYPTIWTGESYMTLNNARPIADATEADIRNISEAVHSRGRVQKDDWYPIPREPSPPLTGRELVTLDFEALTYTPGGRDVIIGYLQKYRKAAPQQRIGFSFLLLAKDPKSISMNVQNFVNPSKAELKAINAAKEYTRPLIKYLDYLNPCGYLLGEATFDRDIAYIKKVADVLRSYDRPVYFDIWGIWHGNWNPEKKKPSRSQYLELKFTLQSCCDGAIIWGPWEDNVELFEVMLADQTSPDQDKATAASKP